MPHDQRRQDQRTAPGRHVLLTGATGFIGSAVVRAVAGQPDIKLSVLVRGPARIPQTRQLLGDLTTPESLIGSCHGIDTLVHTASYVGTDPEQCTAVNDRGTTALLREAARAGVRRIIYMSTAAVYGQGPHRDVEPEQLVPAPRSPASRTRLAAEDMVRAAGGVVLRPHLIYGIGDRWFVPELVTLIPLLDGLPNTDQVRLSTIAIDDLAGALAGLVTRADALPPGTVLHANHPTPTVLSTIIDTVIRHLSLDPTSRNTSHPQANRETRANRDSERHLARIRADHWYTSEHIWRLADHDPGASFAETFHAMRHGTGQNYQSTRRLRRNPFNAGQRPQQVLQGLQHQHQHQHRRGDLSEQTRSVELGNRSAVGGKRPGPYSMLLSLPAGRPWKSCRSDRLKGRSNLRRQDRPVPGG
jgi:nucleoside-diphosphate-sugar epimerase